MTFKSPFPPKPFYDSSDLRLGCTGTRTAGRPKASKYIPVLHKHKHSSSQDLCQFTLGLTYFLIRITHTLLIQNEKKKNPLPDKIWSSVLSRKGLNVNLHSNRKGSVVKYELTSRHPEDFLPFR